MSLLSEENQVLYVEPRPYFRAVVRRLFHGATPGTDGTSGTMPDRACSAGLRAPRLTTVRPGLHVYRPPPYAPLSGRAPLSDLTDALRAASLRRAMRRLSMDRPILWLFRPDMADVPGRYGERYLIYHIVDEYMGYPDVDAARAEDIRRRERDLIAKADLVLVTSRALLESKGGINPDTYWVPNGVDYDRFAGAIVNQSAAPGEDGAARFVEPEEVASLPRPRIGYVGAINDKLDVHLLLQVAEAYSRASMVMVGPVRPASEGTRQGIEMLRARPNVHFVGRVSMEQVPRFVAACDVGLLPYQLNAWTRSIHPLKMYEYLACGLPVVATDIPSVRDEQDVIHIAADSRSFVEAIRQVLDDDCEALRAARQARASQNTWRQRVERISDLIEATIPTRNTG